MTRSIGRPFASSRSSSRQRKAWLRTRSPGYHLYGMVTRSTSWSRARSSDTRSSAKISAPPRSKGTCGAQTAILTLEPLKVRACSTGSPPPSPLPPRLSRKSAGVCNETWQYCADSCAGSSREQRVVERREQEVVQAADVRCNYGVIGFDEPLGRSVQEADLRFGKDGLSREQLQRLGNARL